MSFPFILISVNKKILIIEDNSDIRENIAELLELSGYRVYSADNGNTGIALAVEHWPDIILCDIAMPDLDGYGVLSLLRAQLQIAGTPFIFLTAKAERNDLSRGLGSGADGYLVKPFDAADLLDAIESRLKTKTDHKVIIGSQNALFSDGE
jgi:DNA-binding response OmpR family regulator